MRLLNCFHTIADLELLSEDDWISGSGSGHIDTCYLKQILNCYDESALELACRFRDAACSSVPVCSCTAVTVSADNNKTFLELLAALGFTDTHLISLRDPTSMETLSSEKAVALLYAYIQKQVPFDFILTGAQSGDGSQGKVPFLLAEYLGIRCISNVTDIRPVSETSVSVISHLDSEIREETVSGPAVLVIGNVVGTYLRVPTLRQRMQSRHQEIAVFHEDSLCSEMSAGQYLSSEENIQLLNIEPVIQKRTSEIVNGSDPDEAARILYDHYKKWV